MIDIIVTRIEALGIRRTLFDKRAKRGRFHLQKQREREKEREREREREREIPRHGEGRRKPEIENKGLHFLILVGQTDEVGRLVGPPIK